MPLPEACRLAAEYLPGNGAIEVRLLSQGLDNDTYQARRDGELFALRLTRQAAPEGEAVRRFEAELVAQAAACHLAPSPVYCDPGRGILILRWLPGRVWESGSITSTPLIGQAAHLMHRVHALSVPQPAWRCSAAGWVARYRAALPVAAAEGLQALHEPADAILARLQALPPEALVVCHSDLHRLNVLDVEGGGCVLLDWEYAHLNGPSWDLAGWSANNDFTIAQSRALLAAYGGPPDRICWLRFRLLRWIFDYVCALWTRLYHQRLGSDMPALAARGALLETRLHAAVCGKLDDYDGIFPLES